MILFQALAILIRCWIKDNSLTIFVLEQVNMKNGSHVKQLGAAKIASSLPISCRSKHEDFKFVNRLFKGQKISFKVDRKNPVKILEFSVQTSKTKKSRRGNKN